MPTNQKITPKEWDHFVDNQLEVRGLDRRERETLKSAFYKDLTDVDYGEHQPIFGHAEKGITPKELEETMKDLRNPYSDVSKGLKMKIHETKLDVAEKVLQEALKGQKSGW